MFFKPELTSQHKLSSLEIVQSFAATHYPALILDSKMLEQLLWLQDNSINTSQSNVQSEKDLVNIEVKRILSRLYCLKLLEESGSSSYQLFIRSQSKDSILSENNFQRLSHFIQGLSPASHDCLLATCFITKSDQAIMRVPVDRKTEIPADSEQFITYMVTHFPHVFPVCHSPMLTPAAINLLPYAFYKNSHARQMLDMEGGYNMVSSIAEGICTKAITLEQFNLWFARWIINIAGMDGHLNYNGSIYLTEPIADCIFALKLQLDQLWRNPQHQVLDNYLAFRAKQLEVSSDYCAYLAALMRQYSPNKGREIQIWFEGLKESEKQERLSAFRQQLEQTKVTPTYKPTVLLNLLALGCSVSDALTLFTQIESNAMQTYRAAVAQGLVSDSTPLSFRKIALKEALLPIRDYYTLHNKPPELTIDSGGNLNVAPPEALQDESHVSANVIGR